MVALLGQGVYSVAETARFASVSPHRVRAWFGGWKPGDRPVLAGDYRSDHGPGMLSFLDLVDVIVVGRMRDARVSMPKVKRAYKYLANEFGGQHPFSRRELLVDENGKLFYFQKAAMDLHDEQLIELFSGQHAFPSILKKYLKRIVYDPKTNLARQVDLMDGLVILDPNRRYGKPILKKSGMPTSILARAFKANNFDEDLVADWYGVTPDEVRIASDFETGFAGIAA